jgi:cobalt-zinc-cadmium resistance protein CzcA
VLARLIDWSLRHRLVVCLLWAGVAVAGVLALQRLPIDAFPDTTPVLVQVNTVAPALSPLEIERRATAPIEQQLSGLPGLREVRSLSRFGLSQITLTFEDGTDLWRARQVVGERLAAVELPVGIGRPALGPVATGLGEVFHYLVEPTDDGSGITPTLAELRTAQDWIIRPQLAALPGVAEVNAWGGEVRQVQVVVDPAALAQRGLSLADLVAALEANNASVGGGVLEQSGGSALVQGLALVARPSDVEAIVLDAVDGRPVRVGDVARVVEGHEIRRGAVTADGRGEVVLGLAFLLVGENSHDVTHRLSLALQEVRRTLPAGMDAVPVYERTTLVDHVLETVSTNLFEGALLVVAVLFVFLGNLRAGLLVASAIPLSLLFAFDLMTRAGVAGSLMSLGAIDFGLVVDSSVIQVENTVRRLQRAPAGSDRRAVVREAALEVRRPTLFGEAIIIAVYLPILALQDVEGKLFRPMALTVIFALLGSLLLSLTLMPALSSLVLPQRAQAREGWLMRGLLAAYRPVLAAALRGHMLLLAAAGAAVLAAALLATRLGTEFVPRLNEGTLAINTIRLAGVSLDESLRYGTRIEQALLAAFPDEIERIWSRTGSAEVSTDPMGLELTDVFVTLTPRGQWTRADTQPELVERMAALLADFPAMKTVFTQPIEMRMNEMIAGIRADVGVKLFGDDLELLQAKAAEVQAVLESLPGAAEVYAEQVTGQPVLTLDVDREACARHGIPARDVLAVVEALGGIPAGELQEEGRRFPIAVRLHDAYRLDEQAVGQIPVTAPGGRSVPLAQLARIGLDEGPSTIQREWGKRRVVVQANVRARDVGSFAAQALEEVGRRVALPPGCYVRLGGQFERYATARDRLLVVVPLALALILVLLWFTYGRLRDVLRVFTGVPFAAVGGIAALWLRDLPFSISAGVGFVALSGVSVLADMVLVSTIRQLLDEGLPLREAVAEAAQRRLRPVLMTGLVASLGFLPMALNTGMGAEVQRPLATVVIGGLFSSTLLTLTVLPALYVAFAGRARAPAAAPAAAR